MYVLLKYTRQIAFPDPFWNQPHRPAPILDNNKEECFHDDPPRPTTRGDRCTVNNS